jgi:formylglycine-generating enzyme
MQCRSLLAVAVLTLISACRDHREYAQPTLEREPHARPVPPFVKPVLVPPRSACPDGMTMVEGEHCPVVEHKCLRWLDPPGKWHLFRCAEYSKEVTCRAPKVHKKYCIDTDEAGATPSDPRPANHVSFKMAKQACEARGARLCTESEFEFACEGEEMRPYPYGFVRDSKACNVDREDVVTPNKKAIYDLRRKVGEDARCVSPFGVRNLAGNVEEWTTRDRHTLHTKTTLLKGSWWLKGKHTCRSTNGGHDDWYQGTETGYRCCADAR